MWGRLGPRFAVEALFLILVAVALGVMDLRPLAVVVVMAGAWLLVALIELLASRRPRFAPLVRPGEVVEVATAPVPADTPAPSALVGQDTELGIGLPAGNVAVEAPVARENGALLSEAEELPSEPVAEVTPAQPVVEEVAAEPLVEDAVVDQVEPLAPAPRRRWFGRRTRGSTAAPEAAEGDLVVEAANDVRDAKATDAVEEMVQTEAEEAAPAVPVAQDAEVDQIEVPTPRRGWFGRRVRPESAPEAGERDVLGTAIDAGDAEASDTAEAVEPNGAEEAAPAPAAGENER